MNRLIESNDACALTASSHRDVTGAQVLKYGDTFLLLDKMGEAGVPDINEQGLYHAGTRYLSGWELLIEGNNPMLLNSTMKEDNSVMLVQMTTPDLKLQSGACVAHGTLHIFRSIIVYESAFHERLEITNYSQRTIELDFGYRFSADYRDIFEVRGAKRKSRGKLLESQCSANSVTLGYRALNDREMHTVCSFQGPLTALDDGHCSSKLTLPVGEKRSLETTVTCSPSEQPVSTCSHAKVRSALATKNSRADSEKTVVLTSNERFNQWLERSAADLRMLTTEIPEGVYPYAGVPWFATPFGRDGIITALETLWLQPELAKGTLDFLARTQSHITDEYAEAEPGKIIHEMREGEMAELGEIPFRRYYGTVDATPLFIMLAGQYWRRTGDLEFIKSIWENIRAAVRWMDDFGDLDGDGFLEYQSHHDRGLTHQCWKDSDDSIFHADGRDALGKIAVSEVQGYSYAAKLAAAELAVMLGEQAWADKLRDQASELKVRFNEAFWCERLGSFAIALDGEKRPCEVLNSNAGHLLYTGIVDDAHAESVVKNLIDPRSFNGWGIRTIAADEARYNPMSYHNGSIWPHDTALGVAGMFRYGFRQEGMQVAEGLFEASLFNELHRLPELFCGFDRIPGHGPTLYPVACSPQAWSASAAFLVTQAMMGLTFSPRKPHICFDNPELPKFLNWVRIQNLCAADSSVDLVLRRHPRDVGLSVDRKDGDVEIVVMA